MSRHVLPHLSDLLPQLVDEHEPGFVYRGQVVDYPGPLVPSRYREILAESPDKDIVLADRIRGYGRVFYQFAKLPSEPENAAYWSKVAVAEYARHLFGFPLSQLLLQQYGLDSEGLDVTSELGVAAYFASTDRSMDSHAHGVIFRFRVPAVTKDRLYRNDFYDCPFYLGAQSILSVLESCDDWGEASESFKSYRGEYALRCKAGLSRSRPLHLLKLPVNSVAASRVARQRAGIVFPDMLLAPWYQSLRRRPPKVRSDGVDANSVADLRDVREVSVHRFEHKRDERQQIGVDKTELFPERDRLRDFLAAFLNKGGSPGELTFDTELMQIRRPDGDNFSK